MDRRALTETYPTALLIAPMRTAVLLMGWILAPPCPVEAFLPSQGPFIILVRLGRSVHLGRRWLVSVASLSPNLNHVLRA